MAEESDLEAECVAFVRDVGGEFVKWVSPGKRGVQDRILLLPDRPAVFVELKARRGRPSAMQRWWRGRLRALGQPVHTIDNFDDFEKLVIDHMENGSCFTEKTFELTK